MQNPNLLEAEDAGFGDVPWEGIFVMRGQSLNISSFTITEHEDGQVTATSPTVSTATHMAPYWLAAAVEHCRSAERISHSTNSAFKTGDTNNRSDALTAELIASMQAITCAAFAIDALHASLLHVQPTPEATRAAWRNNGTKRSRQIFETLRRAYKISSENGQRIRTFLDQLGDARDRAVHPPSTSKLAEKHARLPISIDPAFNMFRARNAIVAVGLTVDLIEGAAKAQSAKHPKVRERMASLLELIQPVTMRWRRTKAGKGFKSLQRVVEQAGNNPT